MAEYVTALQDPLISAHVQPGYDPKPLVSAHTHTPIQPQSSPLPPGWLEMEDPSGRTLYCNPTADKTSWERPISRQLPPGWMKSQTPDGKTIFIHPETQRCSYQFPPQVLAPIPPQKPPAPQMPQITRYTTTPGGGPKSQTPTLVRSQTAPAQPAQDSSMSTNVNTAVMRKAVPGFGEALAVHQLSERNNSTVLTKKFASDLALTTTAMKDATISGASLATRQAKVAGQIMVDPKKMQKISRKMVVKTGAVGIKTGRALKSMMGEMVEAADKKGKYQPKNRQFIPYDGQVEYQIRVPVQHPAQPTPQGSGNIQEDEYQQQQDALTSHPRPSSATNTISSQLSTMPIRINAGLPSRRPVRAHPVSIDGTLSLTYANQIQHSNQVNKPPAQQSIPHPEPAEYDDYNTVELQIDVGAQVSQAGASPAIMKPPGSTHQSTLPQQNTSELSQTTTSLNLSSLSVVPKPTQTSSLSLQAQGSVTIQASVDTSDPPPYTQTVQTNEPAASSQAAHRPTARIQSVSSRSRPPPRPMCPQQQLGPHYVSSSQEQATLLVGTAGAGGVVGYEAYNIIQPQSGAMIYQDTQAIAPVSQPIILAPQKENIYIEQNQTIIQQQVITNNETMVVQQSGSSGQEYEVYMPQDMAYTQAEGSPDVGVYPEYATYEEGVAAGEMMYVEAYAGEVYGSGEFDAQDGLEYENAGYGD
ncbi:uncharacterized protein A1O9_08738 [Exophiala aquamarina CBS 119918]|uniref:WW domain-containing protein n=1 Tax=Exophiala aquamarina CBS 119918 TaxID=1182545 RepID=A0A072PHR5_9EURO|nr:uncharacterized protein A1O9_08738 [Exophiala aquamarina CBS 119918]KEF55085.1 hypothetical protein A1O9_08738 [Exophiala aquamarina CBS 119918]